MKARLMVQDNDFHPDPELLEAIDHPYRRPDRKARPAPPVGEQDLIDDLELQHLWEAMSLSDPLVYASVRTAMLSSVRSLAEISYRQAVFADCLADPGVVRQLYAVAVQAVSDERKIWHGMFSQRAETRLQHCVNVLTMLVPVLRELRQIADQTRDGFASDGFVRLFATLRRELDDDYFDEIAQHLRHLHFRDGVLVSARLGRYGQGVDYVLRAPRPGHHGRFHLHGTAIPKPTFSYTVPPRDEGGGQALGRLRDRGLDLVADALGQSTDHILSFLVALRGELAFYVGCLNLHEQLAAAGQPWCLPGPAPTGSGVHHAEALYDPCLALRLPEQIRANELHADSKPLIFVTGANQGGKSTFLRSLGVAHLMMECGMFVAARSFAGSIAGRVFTHYKREEDASMTSGKFDEELARMSRIAAAIVPGNLLLCNESFAATNEREGSDIADEFLQAMQRIGVGVVFVSHLYDLAHRYHEHHADTTVFLRAERAADGRRSYHLAEAAPLPTSYGEDLYRRTFTEGDAVAPASPARVRSTPG